MVASKILTNLPTEFHRSEGGSKEATVKKESRQLRVRAYILIINIHDRALLPPAPDATQSRTVHHQHVPFFDDVDLFC
jgi:hypothetical protein